MSEAKQVPVDVIGMPEFDRLCNILAVIYLMTDDPRIKAFIDTEIENVPLVDGAKRPVHHTFDVLASMPERLQFSEEQRTYMHMAATDLAVPLSCLDDARELSVERTPQYVVLDVLREYLDGLVSVHLHKRIDSQ